MPYITKRKISPPSHKEEHNERRNSKWNKYYQNSRWKKLRDWYMSLHPICADCMINGRSVPATELHHIRPFGTGKDEAEKMRLLLDPDNLVALCSDCHDKRHFILNHTKQDDYFNTDNN